MTIRFQHCIKASVFWLREKPTSQPTSREYSTESLHNEMNAVCLCVCPGVLCTVEMRSWSLAGWCSAAVVSSIVLPPLMPSLISCARSSTLSPSRYTLYSRPTIALDSLSHIDSVNPANTVRILIWQPLCKTMFSVPLSRCARLCPCQPTTSLWAAA